MAETKKAPTAAQKRAEEKKAAEAEAEAEAKKREKEEKAASKQRVEEFAAALREGTPADAPFGDLSDEERAEALDADAARKDAAVSEKAGE